MSGVGNIGRVPDCGDIVLDIMARYGYLKEHIIAGVFDVGTAQRNILVGGSAASSVIKKMRTHEISAFSLSCARAREGYFIRERTTLFIASTITSSCSFLSWLLFYFDTSVGVSSASD